MDQKTGNFEAEGHVSSSRLPDQKKSSSDLLAGDHMVQGDNYLYQGIAIQRKNPRAPFAIVTTAPAVGFAESR